MDDIERDYLLHKNSLSMLDKNICDTLKKDGQVVEALNKKRKIKAILNRKSDLID